MQGERPRILDREAAPSRDLGQGHLSRQRATWDIGIRPERSSIATSCSTGLPVRRATNSFRNSACDHKSGIALPDGRPGKRKRSAIFIGVPNLLRQEAAGAGAVEAWCEDTGRAVLARAWRAR